MYTRIDSSGVQTDSKKLAKSLNGVHWRTCDKGFRWRHHCDGSFIPRFRMMRAQTGLYPVRLIRPRNVAKRSGSRPVACLNPSVTAAVV